MLKHFLLLILFFNLFELTNAQKSNYIGISLAPSLTKLTRHYDETKNPFAAAYGFGLTGNFNLFTRMFLRAGIGYQFKHGVICNEEYFPSDIGTDPIKHNGPTYKYIKNVNYISFPININYRFSSDANNKINYFISGGTTFKSFLSYKATHHYSSGDEIEKREADEFNLLPGLNAGAGIYFKLPGNAMILIEPEYCYDMIDMEGSDKFQSIILNIELTILSNHYKQPEQPSLSQ